MRPRLGALVSERPLPVRETQWLPVVPQRRPPPASPRIGRLADQVPLASVYLLIVTLIVFQRFVVPGVGVSIALPVSFLVLVGLAARGQLVADVSRVALYLASVAVCLLCTVIAAAGDGPSPSFSSLLLLVVLYIPLCFRARKQLRDQFPRVLRFFQTVMLLAAVACVAQWTLQIIGVRIGEDPLGTLIPELVATDFNTSYPIYYGSPILKTNGFVFLEPSFASQFLAIAIIVQILLGRSWWRLALLGVALLTTVSGTGIALLGIGLVTLAIRRGGSWTVRTLVASLLVIVTVSLTPVGALLADRTGESAEAGSSGNARFVAPYVTVADALGRDQEAFLVGRGAGTTDADVEFFNPQGLLVNYAALPKFVGEYGVPASLVFLAFILTVLFRNVPSPTLGVASAAVYFVLSGSLLQPQTVILCWLLTGLFAASRAGEIAGRRIRLSTTVSAGAVNSPRAARNPNGNHRPSSPRPRPTRKAITPQRMVPRARPASPYAEPGTTAVPAITPRIGGGPSLADGRLTQGDTPGSRHS